MASNLPNLLFYDTPERNADLRYLGRFCAPDAFAALRLKGKTVALLNALEYARGQKESAFDAVWSLESLLPKAPAKNAWENLACAVRAVAAKAKVRRLTVGAEFPAAFLRALEAVGLSLDVAQGSLFPERVVKTPAEARAIRAANAAVSRAFAEVERILAASAIKGGYIVFEGRRLTSEFLRTRINMTCLAQGYVARDTIAAGGDIACDPHGVGTGPLKAGELIVVDIFPRGPSGYYGDMTRTYLKGRPREAQTALVETVRAAQRLAMRTIRAGVLGKDVHKAVVDFFNARGFATTCDKHGYSGFFHGTGHGVGLDIHEEPRVSVKGGVLPEGSVVTVEPGLYYRGIGGCRIEDVVQVTKTGVRMLSKHPYRWQFD